MTKQRIIKNVFLNANRYTLIFIGTELKKAFCQEKNKPFYQVFNPATLHRLECLYKWYKSVPKIYTYTNYY